MIAIKKSLFLEERKTVLLQPQEEKEGEVENGRISNNATNLSLNQTKDGVQSPSAMRTNDRRDEGSAKFESTQLDLSRDRIRGPIQIVDNGTI